MSSAFLNKPYNRSEYTNFVKNLLPDFAFEETTMKLGSNSFFSVAHTLGNAFEGELTVLEIRSDSKNIGKRIAITKEAFSILRVHGISNALVAFDDGQDAWRLSLLTTTLRLNDKGKVTSKGSNPRRYSYLLGPAAKTATPYKYLFKQGKVSSLEELRSRFSLEIVNRDFYNAISDAYLTLLGKSNKKAQLQLPNYAQTDKTSQQFAIRLIGRIIFCWFLKQKKSHEGPLIPEELLSSNAVDEYSNYYHDVLEPLFFETLNKPMEEREGVRTSELWQQIPYLNGGLFSEQSDDYYEPNGYGQSAYHNTLTIVNNWFLDLYKTLETYNFTIDENTLVDQEISIDPEMLGRIFENLLAEELNEETKDSARKSTGSFYTPRQIVEYMVDESLTAYLTEVTSVEISKIKALISYNEADDIEHPLDTGEHDKIISALGKLKVLDPACGSGAFPIGMMQKIVFILNKLDPNADKWLDEKLSGITDESFKERIRNSLSNKSLDYIRKNYVIKDTIYGVDIQPIAVEVAKLRCFLTLIIDEEIDDNLDNRGIDTLPNLDFKFVAANTLISPPLNSKGINLEQDFENRLEKAIGQYFQPLSQTAKNKAVIEINNLIREKVREETQILRSVNKSSLDFSSESHRKAYYDKHAKRLQASMKRSDLWESYPNVLEHKTVAFFDTKYFFPSVKDGFDIVIGNPPYIQLQKNGGELADIYQDENYQTFARTGDIYSLFYERGLQLTKSGSGLLCYITSNKWMRAGYGEKLRGFLANKNPLRLIDFGGFKVFESATVDTNILLVQNTLNHKKLIASHFKNDYDKSQPIGEYMARHNSIIDGLSNKTWFIGDAAELALKEKIEKNGRPLKDWNFKINYGIKTGCNNAFIINEAIKNRLIAEDPKSEEIIKPLLRGRDINRYRTNYKNIYLIATFPALQLNIDDYPAVKKYLVDYGREKLEQSGKKLIDGTKTRKKTGNKWFETQDQISYYDEFESTKVVWPMISVRNLGASLVETGIYLNNKCFMITGENIKTLIGILNSKLAWFYFKTNEAPLGNSLEVRTPGMKAFPIPKIIGTYQTAAQQIHNLVDQLQSSTNERECQNLSSQIDQLVYQLYDLSPEEIRIIESIN